MRLRWKRKPEGNAPWSDDQRHSRCTKSGFPLYSFHALDGDLLLDYDSASGKMAEYIYLAGRQIARRDISAATVSLTLAASIPAIQPNQAFNLTATIGSGASGTVTFTLGSTALGTVTIASGSASLARPGGLGTGGGIHTITARYNGDTSHAPATVTLNLIVGGKRFDFNGDGKADVLWRNQISGDTYFYFMNGLLITSQGYGMNAASPWAVAGVGDFDGDGKADILWRNAVTGENYLYPMNGTVVLGTAGSIGVVPQPWIVVGP